MIRILSRLITACISASVVIPAAALIVLLFLCVVVLAAVALALAGLVATAHWILTGSLDVLGPTPHPKHGASEMPASPPPTSTLIEN